MRTVIRNLTTLRAFAAATALALAPALSVAVAVVLAVSAAVAIAVAADAAPAGAAPTANPDARSTGPALSPVPANAPNVVVVLLDDVGFGAAETFGGPVPTPTLDALAKEGLRYNRFHTTGICSPTRASLLTGRNPHAVGVGAVLNAASNHPGKSGILRADAPTLAELLRGAGYATSLFGKWHLTPDWETSPVGPFDRWPTRRGFDHFYGFLGGETHQFEPTLYEGTRPVARPSGDDYHLTDDLVRRASQWMALQHSLRPERPFFVYLATGATHAPIHAPKAWIDKFRGRFDQGWDAMRRISFARQKEAGVIPADTLLTPRPEMLPAWDSLSADERAVAARFMEANAGFLAHTDHAIGELVATLERLGELDDTLFVYIVGDNGASAEGGLLGSWNYFAGIHGLSEDIEKDLGRLDAIGGPASYPHYPAGWAWALDAPFQWAKTIASHLGGTRNPLVVHWPKGMRARGELRSQFAHVNDLAPTILEATGLARLDRKGAMLEFAGRAAPRFDGTSLVYSFDDAGAASRHTTQYFEVFGHRAIYRDGWLASAFRGRAPWRVLDPITRPLDQDRWELYDLEHDFSQGRDLAASEPDRLVALKEVFLAEAARNQVLPIGEDAPGQGLPQLHQDRRQFVFYEGAVGIPESGAPPIANRSYEIRAEVAPADAVDDAGRRAPGVIATEGGVVAGWALYVDGEGRPAYHYNFFDAERLTIVAEEPLPAGLSTVRFAFEADGGIGAGGRGRLYVGDRLVGEGRIERTAPRFFSIDETFDVGIDTGSPAGDYPPGSPFHGRIERVEFRLD